MIRNAVLHLLNEQPLLADLPVQPTAGDGALLCTNLRTMDGKRPFFVDSSASTFVFPLTQMRFVEIPAAAAGAGGPPAMTPDAAPIPATEPPPPATVAGAGEPDADELELDEELLRRVREI